MDVLAVIPATGSAAVRRFAGSPLALHALDQARTARRITRVAIVTDDPLLARLAADGGADVVAPPSEEGRAAPLRAALELLAGRDGLAPMLALVIDPTFPLNLTKTIDGAIEHLLRCGADSLLCVQPLRNGLWVQDERGTAAPFAQAPAQQCYAESGIAALVRVGVFEQTGDLACGRVVLYEVPPLAALQIDDEESWGAAEGLMRSVRSYHARALLRSVRLLVLDFDGVMTDNRVLVMEDGREAVLCSRGDGMGLEMLRKAGLPVMVISKEVNPVVGARCRKLKLRCEQGIEDKLGVLTSVVDELELSLSQVAYIGNDVNDLACMTAVGVPISPADGHPDALRAARIVTDLPGGMGAVREICDLLLAVGTEAPSPADS